MKIKNMLLIAVSFSSFFTVISTTPAAKQAQLDKELCKTIYFSQTEEVQKLIKKGANVNTKEIFDFGGHYDNWTPLLLATYDFVPNADSRSTKFKIAKLLIDHGAKVNVQAQTTHDTDVQETPLWLALRSENWPLIELLINKGAYVDSHNGSRSPMSAAQFSSNPLPFVKYLVEHGAQVNGEYNPLLDFIRDLPTTHYLLEHGADVNVQNSKKESLLHLALSINLMRIYDSLEKVKLLVQHGAHVNSEDCDKKTPLFYISNLAPSADRRINNEFDFDTNQLEVAKVLIENGGDVNAQCLGGSTPLMEALRNKNFSFARLLIKHNADINISDNYGTTALHIAVWVNDETMIRFLIELGAIITADKNGNTPLYYAVQNKNLEMIKLFLALGAC